MNDEKKRHLKINGLFFFFDFLFYLCRRCWSGDGDFSLAEKQRQHITGTMTKKPMMKTKKKSFLWCDVTATAEMFLDLKKICEDLFCLFWITFVSPRPQLYVTKLNILIKRVLSNRTSLH